MAWAEASTTSEDKTPQIVICLMGQEVSEQLPVYAKAVTLLLLNQQLK